MSTTAQGAKGTAQRVVGQELAAVLPANPLPWYRTRHLLLLNVILLVPLCSSAGVGFDGSMMNGLQVLEQWRSYFNHPSAPILGAINAIYPVCKILCLFVASWVSDRYGRKTSMLIGLIVMLIGPTIQASSQNLPMFIVARGVVGAATVFVALPSPILITELAYPTHRAKITALYNTFFYFGAISAAWSTYATFKLQSTWSWRIPSALQAAIPVLQLLGFYFLPESPRWLIAHGKVDQARAILSKHHAAGDLDSPLVAYEITEIEQALRLDRENETKASWLMLFSTKANRHRVLIAFILGFFSQWNGISVVTYYLTLVLNTVGITSAASQALINGLLQIFNFAAAVFAGALLVDRVGRRRLLLVSTGGLFVSYICWTALTSHFVRSHDERAGYAVVAFIFIAFFFYDIAWTPLVQAYTIEIFPYNTRAKGLTVTMLSSYTGLITSQLINPVALRSIGWRYYIVFCCILAVLFGAIYMLLPETRGRSLEEVAELFDGRSVTISAADVLDEHTKVKAADGHGDVEEVESSTYKGTTSVRTAAV